jgi:hypothetical protein
VRLLPLSRRIGPAFPRLTRIGWESAAQPLEDFLRWLYQAWGEGIPPGFLKSNPTTIEAGVSADPGEELSGWAAADHTHAVSTADPVIIGTDNDEGSSASLARADHTHQKLPREFLLMGG